MTRFLSTAITCAAAPLRTRLTSSFKVPSRRPCSPFSIPQCARTHSNNAAAPARSRGWLAIPKTTSCSTFSPIRRSRSKRNTCRQPGQSAPQYWSSHVVVSSVRFSIRPCPLSTVVARSMQAWRCALWRGGKAGLGLGESGRDVGAQGRLVVLDRQDVVPAACDYRGADLAVSLDGVGGEDPAVQGQDRQHLQRRLQLVGLGVDTELSHDAPDCRALRG